MAIASIIPPGTLDLVEQPSDTYTLLHEHQPLCRIKRGSDGWKFWLTSCEITFGDRRLRTKQALNEPRIDVVDEQNHLIAEDRYSGGAHTIRIGDQTLRTHGSHDIERATDVVGAPLLAMQWQGTYPKLRRISVQQPVDALALVVVTAIALHYGTQRGGDRQSW